MVAAGEVKAGLDLSLWSPQIAGPHSSRDQEMTTKTMVPEALAAATEACALRNIIVIVAGGAIACAGVALADAYCQG
jgi:NAD(P)H-dependent flavin oxidoreductase YrpB (nitropropane dioxygenase family)